MSNEDYIDPATLDSLGNMKVRAKTLVDGILAGLHRSPHRGGSVEFAEYTEYTPGDEIRHVDWKVYAKTDEYYIKQYEDETNLRAFLVMDGSGSMAFQSEDAPMSKMRYVSHLAATFGHLLLRQGDAVGGLSFDDETRDFLPPSSSSTHLDDLTYLLDELRGAGGTALADAFRTLAERAPPRSLVLVFSDFLDIDDEALNLLKVLKEQRRDVAVFHVVDPAEVSLPYEGLRIFEGMESDDELLAEPDDLRDVYQQKIRGHFDRIQSNCEAGSIGYQRFATTQPIEQVCLDFLRGRL